MSCVEKKWCNLKWFSTSYNNLSKITNSMHLLKKNHFFLTRDMKSQSFVVIHKKCFRNIDANSRKSRIFSSTYGIICENLLLIELCEICVNMQWVFLGHIVVEGVDKIAFVKSCKLVYKYKRRFISTGVVCISSRVDAYIVALH